jgi:hypothetical protein
MEKQISIRSAVVVVLIIIGIIGVALALAPVADENSAVNAGDKELVSVEKVVKEFMEEAYIRENFKKASGSYIPPDGFETFVSMEPISLAEYIEWYVRSVNLKSQGIITHVQVVGVERSEESQLFKVTFHFIKEDGEPVRFGPCCGEEGEPNPDMITYVKKVGSKYKIFESLPYIP